MCIVKKYSCISKLFLPKSIYIFISHFVIHFKYLVCIKYQIYSIWYLSCYILTKMDKIPKSKIWNLKTLNRKDKYRSSWLRPWIKIWHQMHNKQERKKNKCFCIENKMSKRVKSQKMWENSRKSSIWKGSNTRIHNGYLELSNKMTAQSQNGRRIWVGMKE